MVSCGFWIEVFQSCFFESVRLLVIELEHYIDFKLWTSNIVQTKRVKWNLFPPVFWSLLWWSHSKQPKQPNEILKNAKFLHKNKMITLQIDCRKMYMLENANCPRFKIFWKWICPLQYFLKEVLIALFYICIMILRLKATSYLFLALMACIILDSPTTLGTQNLVMSAYILRLKIEW